MAVAIAVKKARLGAATHAVDFETFYATGYQTVYRAALAFSNSTEIANDATQEAFVRAFARWRRLRKEQWAMAWVMTTALNAARKLLQGERRKSRRAAPSDHVRESETTLVERIDLVSELAALPPRQRQAVVLHYIGGLQISEVAELMNVSVGGVKSHLFKARAALRGDAERSRGAGQ
ncbi:MAG TPA: sigma-70 family RNA polymerase sigma factor [Actinomycetota bacterium]|nr:sigma-70 family RNA polymerase sigma factor [Actinomycetota bacterium]